MFREKLRRMWQSIREFYGEFDWQGGPASCLLMFFSICLIITLLGAFYHMGEEKGRGESRFLKASLNTAQKQIAELQKEREDCFDAIAEIEDALAKANETAAFVELGKVVKDLELLKKKVRTEATSTSIPWLLQRNPEKDRHEREVAREIRRERGQLGVVIDFNHLTMQATVSLIEEDEIVQGVFCQSKMEIGGFCLIRISSNGGFAEAMQ